MAMIQYYNDKLKKTVEVDFETFKKEVLVPNGLQYHHTAYARGYQSVKHDYAHKYEGRFGKGMKITGHNPNSTYYCFVSYYV